MKKIAGVLLFLFFGTANAVPIVYEGELFDGVINTGSISDPFSNSDFWSFDANVGDSIILRVDRLDIGLDPALNLYSGIQTDTDTLSPRIAFADDEIANPGPFGDPLLFFNITSAGTYTVAVWDFISSGSGPYSYEISLTGANPAAVPEPSILALLGLGILGLGYARRKNTSA